MKHPSSITRPRDLTEGKPLPVLTLYAIPMLASMFFQQAYNLADSWIAGNRIGAAALGAVGTCYPITVFFIAIASGLSMGASIYCSQQFGAKAYGEVRSGIATALGAFLPFSVFLCAAGLSAVPSILRWLAVPADALVSTRTYLSIYLAGIPFLFLYNICNGILNGLGDSRTPLYLLILSTLCNIILDLGLVIVIPLGVAGLALATLLSQAAASVATFLCVRRMQRELGTRQTGFSRAALADMLRLGIPSVIQHVFMSTGQLFLQNVINGYGLIVMAGYSVAFRINGLVINSLMALSNALSGFIAQNQGAKKPDRIRQGYRTALTISLLFSLASVLFLGVFGRSVLAFFLGDDPDREAIIQAGMGFIRIVTPFYLLVCVKIVSDGALRGIGAMNAFMLATVTDNVLRIFLGAPFSRRFGILGVWWIWPLAWLVGTSLSVGFWIWKRPQC